MGPIRIRIVSGLVQGSPEPNDYNNAVDED
jgi:hypothetical protein